MIKSLITLFFIVSLQACSGAEDNSEPPSELVDFSTTAKIVELWSTSVGDGDEQQYLKLYPLMLKDRLVVASRNGDIVALNIETGEKIWQLDLEIILSGGVVNFLELFTFKIRA